MRDHSDDPEVVFSGQGKNKGNGPVRVNFNARDKGSGPGRVNSNALAKGNDPDKGSGPGGWMERVAAGRA